jgi:hypothetical protein
VNRYDRRVRVPVKTKTQLLKGFNFLPGVKTILTVLTVLTGFNSFNSFNTFNSFNRFLTILTGFNTFYILTIFLVKGTNADTVEVKDKKIQEI